MNAGVTKLLPIVAAVGLLAIAGSAQQAETRPVQSAPTGQAGVRRSVAGSIKGLPEGGGKAVAAFGRQGCMVIRTAERWEETLKKLADLGWQMPPEAPLGKLDFAKDMVVLVFDYGDEGNVFGCRRLAAGDENAGGTPVLRETMGETPMPRAGGTPATRARLEVVMSYIIYKKRTEAVNSFNFILVAVPKVNPQKEPLEELEVSVWTYHPANGGPYPTPDKAKLEWKATIGRNSGDVVDGLQAVISSAPTAAAGGDVLVEFKLQLASPAPVKDGAYAKTFDSAWVWDGKYSNGYRNHAFVVTTPDGKTATLRPKVIDAWDKNAPHPVQITADTPYILPTWTGQAAKTLKELGLDTSKPGKYVITGLYAQSGGEGQSQGRPIVLWGGQIASNEIAVEVK